MRSLHSIGGFARLTGLSVKALRNYADDGLLAPAHVDPHSRHRSYSEDQVAVGTLIRSLRDVDLPLPLIHRALRDPGQLPAILTAHRRDLEARITHDQRTLHRLVHLQSGEPMSTAADSDLKGQAKAWFNGTWTLLEQPGRSPADDDRMLHMAHASRFAWGEIGGPKEWAIGEWQCARVYSVLGRAEPALHHARRCLAISLESHDIPTWLLASAHEGLARAAMTAGDRELTASSVEESERLLATVENPEDAAIVRSDLATIVIPD